MFNENTHDFVASVLVGSRNYGIYVWLDDFLEKLILDNLKSPVT